MNACARFEDELVDVAFGEAPSRALAQHVESCAACAARLERDRVLASRVDDVVSALVRSEPSPQFLDGIVTRARNTRIARWNPAWLGVPAGAALAAVVFIFVVALHGPHARNTDTAVAITAWRSPTAVLLAPQTSVVQTPYRDNRSI